MAKIHFSVALSKKERELLTLVSIENHRTPADQVRFWLWSDARRLNITKYNDAERSSGARPRIKM